MRTSGGVLILLAVACMLCGCLDTSASPPATPTGGGITPIDLSEPPEAYTLAEALSELDLLKAEGSLNVTGAAVHQVLGSGVGLDGRAATWALGLQDEGEVRWLTFGLAGWKEISLRAPLPPEEVILADIVTPENLLAAQERTISPVMERLGASTVDIGLAEGVYTVTIRTDAGMESLAFRADTGKAAV